MQSLHHDLIILFLFSFLFSLSTLFLCIVSASFSYRAFSSFAARLSLSAVILLCKYISNSPLILGSERKLCALGFLLFLHLLLLCLHNVHGHSLRISLLIRIVASFRAECALQSMPLLSWWVVSVSFNGSTCSGHTVFAHSIGRFLSWLACSICDGGRHNSGDFAGKKVGNEWLKITLFGKSFPYRFGG
jgi:hypothetical protein